MTVAMSVLIHGEAVRFNRGKSGGDDFDFKYMRGRDGNVYPYVSSQCYKRFWRESLSGPFSPIKRAGNDKNQAYTSGNPLEFIDDDLFGYMIAGAATDNNEDEGDAESEEGQDNQPIFDPENIKDAGALKARLLDGSSLSDFILQAGQDPKEVLEKLAPKDGLEDHLLKLLNAAARKGDLEGVEGLTPLRRGKPRKTALVDEVQKTNKAILLRAFRKELQERPKRPTTKRTAPVRMHALVAFSGIKTAKDFQTLSRDIAYTGMNSVLNPSPPGIYSGWLKTRILIESSRIGKFYVGENMDILRDQVVDQSTLQKERNPYSSSREDSVEYVQLGEPQRTERLRAVLRALADIGNRQGPASGALHDGSLRPKAFVAGMMNCADSPFDYVWKGRQDDGVPHLDVNLLRESILDWEDLFANRKIYIGAPAEIDHQFIKDSLGVPSLTSIGFEAFVDTPRKALLVLAKEASL